jgi:hypothetical protein
LSRADAVLALGAAALALACGGGPPALTACVAHDDLTPICQFQNPEDLAVVGDWLLVSQYPADDKPGSLVAFRPSDGRRRALYPLDGAAGGSCASGAPPPAKDFAPHGIDLAGTTLLVVNHGSREAIEEFALGADEAGPTLAWRHCTALPDDALANDVAALNNGGFVATKMVQRPRLLGMLKLALGASSGALLRMAPGATAWEVVPNTQGRGPNGVEEAPDGTLFVSEWGAQRVLRVAPDGSARTEIPLDFSPDNLSWASDGRLLVAGQRASVFDVPRCASVDHGTCSLPTVVAAIDPTTLAVTLLVVDDPAATVGAGSVAVELGGDLWIGTFAGDRLVRRTGTQKESR